MLQENGKDVHIKFGSRYVYIDETAIFLFIVDCAHSSTNVAPVPFSLKTVGCIKIIIYQFPHEQKCLVIFVILIGNKECIVLYFIILGQCLPPISYLLH